MAIIKAPFTEEQVRHLNDFQVSGHFHPFTCGTKEKHQPGDDERLIATREGWVCPSCDYKQNWAHDFMAQSFPNQFVDPLEMTLEQSQDYLRAHGYDPDELAKHGVTFVRMASLVAKIRNIVYQDEIPAVKYLEIQQLIKDYEEETKDEDAPSHNEGKASDDDV